MAENHVMEVLRYIWHWLSTTDYFSISKRQKLLRILRWQLIYMQLFPSGAVLHYSNIYHIPETGVRDCGELESAETARLSGLQRVVRPP